VSSVAGRLSIAKAAVAALVILVVTGTTSSAAAKPENDVLVAYVLLTMAPDGETEALARIVLSAGADCPAIVAGDRRLETTVRANPHPETFPVVVCEAVYPFGTAGTVEGSDVALPVVDRDPRRLAVFGDTGCDGPDHGQDCGAGPAAWPFADFTAWAASQSPDLVIHVGDYNYRGTPGKITIDGQHHWVYDAGDGAPLRDDCLYPGPYFSQNVPGSADWDNWADWRDEFFLPAAPLLARAPWVFVRGNHELCSRAGPGWFYFLAPGSPLLGGDISGLDCAGVHSRQSVVFVPPYRVSAGPIDLMVVDTANACDFGVVNAPHYVADFNDVARLTTAKPTWLVSHRPIWGLRGFDVNDDRIPDNYLSLSDTLQQSLRKSDGGALPSAVDLVLSGHIHLFQSVTFRHGRRPPQVIVGDGGVELPKLELKRSMSGVIDGIPAHAVTRDEFGFLMLDLDSAGGWKGRVINPTVSGPQAVIAHCGTAVAASGQICVPATGN
jgi:hypothetical protein